MYAYDVARFKGVSMSLFDLGRLPLYNQDMDNEKAPRDVQAWKKEVEEADAIFFACPEHNYSMTAAMKNALDWASKNPRNLWKGKVGGIVGAGGGAGTARSQLALRQSGVFLDITFMNSPEVCIKRFSERDCFDKHGKLVSETWKMRVADMLDRTIALARKMKEEDE